MPIAFATSPARTPSGWPWTNQKISACRSPRFAVARTVSAASGGVVKRFACQPPAATGDGHRILTFDHVAAGYLEQAGLLGSLPGQHHDGVSGASYTVGARNAVHEVLCLRLAVV